MLSSDHLNGLGPPSAPPSYDSRKSEQHENGLKKRRRTSGASKPNGITTRRKNACQSCRIRKVKCDNQRPCCAFCLSSGVECVNIDNEPKLQMKPATQCKYSIGFIDNIFCVCWKWISTVPAHLHSSRYALQLNNPAASFFC